MACFMVQPKTRGNGGGESRRVDVLKPRQHSEKQAQIRDAKSQQVQVTAPVQLNTAGGGSVQEQSDRTVHLRVSIPLDFLKIVLAPADNDCTL